MRSNELSEEQELTLQETDLVIGKWFKEQRVNNWKKLGFSEPMSPQAMGEWYGFSAPRASRRIFDIERGKNLPPRKTLHRMCMMLGFLPQAMYNTDPFLRFRAEEEEHLKALKKSREMHIRNAAAHDKHMAFVESDVSEDTQAEEVETIGEYA